MDLESCHQEGNEFDLTPLWTIPVASILGIDTTNPETRRLKAVFIDTNISIDVCTPPLSGTALVIFISYQTEN